MMDLPPLASILIVFFLIFANGFFVAAEFALVTCAHAHRATGSGGQRHRTPRAARPGGSESIHLGRPAGHHCRQPAAGLAG